MQLWSVKIEPWTLKWYSWEHESWPWCSKINTHGTLSPLCGKLLCWCGCYFSFDDCSVHFQQKATLFGDLPWQIPHSTACVCGGHKNLSALLTRSLSMHGILMLKMGKGFLNTEKVDYIKLTAFRMLPLKSKETYVTEMLPSQYRLGG